jgi:hypothetical protein
MGAPMLPGDTWLLISYMQHSLAHVVINTEVSLDQIPPLQRIVADAPKNNINDTYSKS